MYLWIGPGICKRSEIIEKKITIYAPMIYTAPCVMFLMQADTLCGQVGGGWALEIKSFLGPVKWHRAVRRVLFGAQKTRMEGVNRVKGGWRTPPPTARWAENTLITERM